MKRSYKLKYHKLEKNHWWFKARRDAIFRLIQQINLDNNAKILDIGCSGGPVMQFLKKKGYGEIYGIDISKNAVRLCQKNKIKNVSVMDGAKPSFSNEKFDLIIASDILEHIKNDSSALVEWKRILKPGGKLIVFVPAFNLLWSRHDELNHHCRRYEKSELVKLLKKVNLKIRRSSYSNFSIFIPIALVRLYQRYFLKQKGGEDNQLSKINPQINGVLTIVLKIENLLLKFIDFPVGVSVFVVGEK